MYPVNSIGVLNEDEERKREREQPFVDSLSYGDMVLIHYQALIDDDNQFTVIHTNHYCYVNINMNTSKVECYSKIFQT